jgi:hypothetical protein
VSKKPNLIKADYENHQILTPVCTLNFCDLEKPYQYDDKAPKYFRAQLIFDSLDDLQFPSVNLPQHGRMSVSLVDAIRNVKTAQWGDESLWPEEEYPVIKDGNTVRNKEGEQVSFLAGKWLINAKTGEEYPPVYVDEHGKPCDASKFKKGDLVQAQILVRPYLVSRRNQGVTLRLVALKFVQKGQGSNSVWFNEESDLTESSSDIW